MNKIYVKGLNLRKLRFILKKALRLKTIIIVFIALIVLDAFLIRIVGENYEDKYPFIFLIITPLLIYTLLGFGARIALKIEKSKRYYFIAWIVSISFILFLLSFVAPDIIHTGRTTQNIFAAFFVSSIFASFLLLALQIRKLRVFHISAFFEKINLNNISIGVNFLLLLVLVGLVFYGSNKFQILNKRLEIIENKLGGPAKIGCNEKDTVGKIRQSVVRIVGGEAEGSGFAIQSGGMILTNFHVIEFEPSPKVILPDNTFDTAEILMVDKNADLAIIKINKELPVISWGDPKELNPAEELLAIGFPLGGQLVGEASVNKGSLAGRRRSKDVGVEYLQTDITLTPGVSGGPMVNICGEVMGINTSGLAGLGLAISSDSIKQKWLEMSTSKDSLKDIKKIVFDDATSADFAVATFYNYLKVRKLEKAFEFLSDNFKQGHGFDYWKQGYQSLLDTTVIKIEEDKDKKDRVNIKLSTKDMVDDEIVYRYFEGYWDVKNVDGKWSLWEPKIKEVKKPGFLWFYE